MKKIRYSILILLAVWLLIFQVNPIQFLVYDLLTALLVSGDTPTIDLEEIPQNTVFLDTRSKIEYEISHLPQAQWIGFNNPQFDQLPTDKNQPIVVYCSIGVRSGEIGKQLITKGYKQVYNLDGGLFKWYNLGNPVVRNGKSTKDIHPYSGFWGLWLESTNRIYSLPAKPRKIPTTER